MTRVMKNSGIEWIGEIPEGWEIKSLKNISANEANAIVDGPFGSDMKNEEYVESGIPIIQLNNIGDGIHKFSNLIFISEAKALQLKRHVIFPGEIVIAKMMPAGRAAIVSDRFDKYIVSSDSIRLKLNDKNVYQFFAYCLNTYMKNEAEILSTGTTRVRINLTIVKRLHVAVPHLGEQTRIADYLDSKCNKIDEIIEMEKQVIEKLKAYKQSVITEAVTKGLDPNVPMKDSGIEWIGEIPEGWTITQLKYLCNVIDPQPDHRAPAMVQDGGYPYIGIRDVDKSGNLIFETARMVSKEAIEKQERAFKVDKEDILFGKVGTLGNPVFIKPKARFAISATLVLIKVFEEHDCRFVKYLLESEIVNSQIGLVKQGSTRPSLGIMQIRDFYVTFPHFYIQNIIATFLDDKCSKIDPAINQKENLIEKLTQYKKSLIYECVTGKREV